MAISKEQGMLYQRGLRETVAPQLKIDGILGQASMIALQTYARTHGINPPSDFSGPALELLDKFVKSRYVTDKAFSDAAALLGCKEAHVRAVAEVESRGAGFLPNGLVKILFERHWFYKKIKEAIKRPEVFEHISKVLGYAAKDANDLLNALSVREPNICSTTTGGYVGNEGEYRRLEKASEYDLECALQACSFGAYQIMGFNAQVVGYSTANEMFRAFSLSETEQFEAFIRFIKADDVLLKSIRSGNWTVFAERYNGKDYAKNKYDQKMAEAARRWSKTA